MRTLHRTLVIVHRYVGIPMSVVFVIWFASGIVMMYTGGMPSLSSSERLAQRAALDFSAVDVSAAEASETAGFDPSGIRLVTVMGRPAWRLETRRGSTTVFADTGELLGRIGPAEARAVASRFTGIAADRIRHERTLERPDQWTLTLAGSLPLLKLTADDARGTQIYVSPYRAEVALVTDRIDRALAWAGAIPHWFYITPLRTNQPVWYWSIVTASSIGTVLALAGLILGVTTLRLGKASRQRSVFPYSGWMHWHHVLGLVFGVFVLTWVFSGLLSMEPLGWTRMQGTALERGALEPGRIDAHGFGELDAAALTAAAGGRIAELELVRSLGEPYYVARGTALDEPALIDAHTLEPRQRAFGTEALIERVENAASGHAVVEHTLLSDYDAYYYSRTGSAPLPVLRMKLDDAASTWAYVDPARARLEARYNRRERLERWLYYGLHSLDFSFWYDRRPLWDIGLIVLSLGGLASSGAGLVLGYGRIRRFFTRRRRSAVDRGRRA